MNTLPGGANDRLAGALYFDTTNNQAMQNTGTGYVPVGGQVLGAQTQQQQQPVFNANLYNAQYDTQRSQLQNQLNTLPAAQQAAQLKALNSYQTNLNGLDTQNAQGQRNLQVATNQVNTSKAQSLQQLKDQVGTMYNSYLRQPGVSDSSAGSLIGQALGASASKNRAGVLQNAGNQLQGIGMQQQDLATSYHQQHAALDSWKNETLSGIAQQFMQQQQSLQQQMAGADAQKAQGLAQQNSALTQQAVAALQNLQNLYKTQSEQLVNQYQNPQAPNVDLGGLGQYQTQAISAGQLQGIGAIPQANQSQTPDLAAPLFKKQDQFNF